MITVGDCYEVLDPSLTKDGHHGPAFEAFFRKLCGSTWRDDPTKHRYAQKIGIIPPVELRCPPEGIHPWSIENLRIEDSSIIIAEGPIPIVLSIDACSFGYWRGARVDCRRTDRGGRTDVPYRPIQIHKSLTTHASPPQTQFLLDRAWVYGTWVDSPIVLGSDNTEGMQEDHSTARDCKVLGGFDPYTDDVIDLWRGGLLGSGVTWSNTRRNLFDNCYIAKCGFAFGSKRGGARFMNCNVDGCRDVYWFAGAQNKAVVIGGEAENCQRFVVDALGASYDCSLAIEHFTCKLDRWRPGLRPPPSVSQEVMDREFKGGESLGWWKTSGGLKLYNVTVSHLPVRRETPTAPLRYARNLREVNGVEVYERTTIPAPRFHVLNDAALVSTTLCSAYGYKSGAAFTRVLAGRARHELWNRTEYHGGGEGPAMIADNQDPATG